MIKNNIGIEKTPQPNKDLDYDYHENSMDVLEETPKQNKKHVQSEMPKKGGVLDPNEIQF